MSKIEIQYGSVVVRLEHACALYSPPEPWYRPIQRELDDEWNWVILPALELTGCVLALEVVGAALARLTS